MLFEGFHIRSLLILLLSFLHSSLSMKDEIRIGNYPPHNPTVSVVPANPFFPNSGGIFEAGDGILEMAFRSAVDRINSDKKILPRTKLVAQVERIEKGDSFSASKRSKHGKPSIDKVLIHGTFSGCALVERGVAAIFGPQSIESSTHIQSICATLNIPHVESRLDFSPFPANQSVNLYPHPTLLGAAIRDLIKNKKWRKFAIVYQENEGKPRRPFLLERPTKYR